MRGTASADTPSTSAVSSPDLLRVNQWNLSAIVDRVIRGRLHNPYGNTTDVLERFAQEFLPERAARPPGRGSGVAADLDLAFSRHLGYCVAFAGGAVLAAMYLELEHFAANYYPEGPTASLVVWRLLLNLGWLAALGALYTIARNRKELLGVRSVGSFARSALVALFTLAAVIVAVPLPYWGFIGNLWGL
jgi:hypothetical protein